MTPGETAADSSSGRLIAPPVAPRVSSRVDAPRHRARPHRAPPPLRGVRRRRGSRRRRVAHPRRRLPLAARGSRPSGGRSVSRRSPIIVAHASELAAPGDFVTHDALGVPLVVARGARRHARARFLNVCRHRGARLADAPAREQEGVRLRLPRLDLRPRRRARSTSRTPRASRATATAASSRVPVEERAGFVWVVPDAARVDRRRRLPRPARRRARRLRPRRATSRFAPCTSGGASTGSSSSTRSSTAITSSDCTATRCIASSSTT